MDKNIFIQAILDQFKYPVVFVNNDHVIEYMNRAAVEKYRKRGGAELLNRSIFDCHSTSSKEMILEYHRRFLEGEDEIFLKVNNVSRRVYMVAVRGSAGELLGYYERFEDEG